MSSFGFDLDDVKLNFIASKLGLSKKGVKSIYAEYISKIDGLMKRQYLAHSIRALEEFVYVEKNNKRVHVMLKMLPCPIPLYLYFEKEMCFFIICPETFTSKKIRMCIAHELGHLFFNTQERKGVYGKKDEEILEAVADVFGLFLIFGRDKLYSEKSRKLDVFSGKTWKNITEEYAEFCGKIDSQRTDDVGEEKKG